MFFVHGDCNWRHNFACIPELHPIAAFFFFVGIISSVGIVWKKRLRSFPHLFLLWWAAVMTLPATLTREGLPHALRAIGMIPPVFILAGYGGHIFAQSVLRKIETWYEKFPNYREQLARIGREFAFLFLFVPLLIPFSTYERYFSLWASKPQTYSAFATNLYHIGQFLDALPDDTKKYVFVNMPGTEVRGIPMPAQTVMYTTGTFTESKRRERNIIYLLPNEFNRIKKENGRMLITLLDGSDDELRKRIHQTFPDFRESAPGDFVVYTSY
jgi:hypothetical protein